MALVPQAQAICDATNAIEPIVLCDDTLAESSISLHVTGGRIVGQRLVERRRVKHLRSGDVV